MGIFQGYLQRQVFIHPLCGQCMQTELRHIKTTISRFWLVLRMSNFQLPNLVVLRVCRYLSKFWRPEVMNLLSLFWWIRWIRVQIFISGNIVLIQGNRHWVLTRFLLEGLPQINLTMFACMRIIPLVKIGPERYFRSAPSQIVRAYLSD